MPSVCAHCGVINIIAKKQDFCPIPPRKHIIIHIALKSALFDTKSPKRYIIRTLVDFIIPRVLFLRPALREDS